MVFKGVKNKFSGKNINELINKKLKLAKVVVKLTAKIY